MNSENNDAKKQTTPADRKKVGKKILVFFGWNGLNGFIYPAPRRKSKSTNGDDIEDSNLRGANYFIEKQEP